MKPLLTLIVVVAALAVAAPAMAEVTWKAPASRAFTNSANNTQWFSWQAPSGTTPTAFVFASTRTESRYPRPPPAGSPERNLFLARLGGVATLEEG